MKMWSSKVYCLVLLSLCGELGRRVSGQDVCSVTTCTCRCESCGNTDVIRDLQERINRLESAMDQTVNETVNEVIGDCNNVANDGPGSGVHRIRPEDSEPFDALCVFDSDGKWTVIQQRVNGEVDFNRGWNEYREGFGVMTDGGSFWLGVEKMHQITKQRQYRLRIDLKDWDDTMYYAEYSLFAVGDETSKYSLRIDGHSGSLPDALISRGNGNRFSTFDMDNDGWDNNCAQYYVSGWWHDACFAAQLNGPYRDAGNERGAYAMGIIWAPLKGYYYSMKYSRMRIRPNLDN